MLFGVIFRKLVLTGVLVVFCVVPVMSYAADKAAIGDGQQIKQIEKRDAAIKSSGLAEQKKDVVIRILYKYDDIKEDIQQERAGIYAEIKRLVDAGKISGKPDEQAISTQLKKLEATNVRWQNEKKSREAELKEALKPSEEAELLLILNNKNSK